MKGERAVGGLRCSEVLALLPEYVAGTLGAPEQTRLGEHVGGCSVCERFGGSYAAAVQQLRASLSTPPSADEQAAMARLKERLFNVTD
jgi:hypothetical protein